MATIKKKAKIYKKKSNNSIYGSVNCSSKELKKFIGKVANVTITVK